MTCSSIAGVGQSPYQFVQPATQSSADNAASTSSASTDPASAALAQAQLQAQSLPQHHHHHHGGGGSNRSGAVSDLLDTLAGALQSADSSSDPNQVIEDTVSKLLAGNGTTGGTSGTNADGDADGSVAATGQSTTGQSQTGQTFAQLLQTHGVTFQQFRSDLLAAVKGAQNGQVNAATALQSFPSGSSLNLTA